MAYQPHSNKSLSINNYLQIFAHFKVENMMQRKRSQNFMPVIFAAIFLLGLVMGYGLNSRIGGGSFWGGSKNSSLQEISNLVKSKYVDEVGIDSINAFAVEEMLSHLDPHSIYISPTELARVNDQMDGHFTGVGILYDMIDDTLNIMRLIKDGPAEKAGVMIGDKLIKINDSVNVVGKKINDESLRKNIKGIEGSIVKFTFLRDGKEKKIEVKRAQIPIPSIDASYVIENKTGYIRINKFAERTYEEFMQSLEGLQKQKIENLILDLRGNGGGYMHAATAIADEFLDGDKLIVYTQGNKSEKNEFRCRKEGLFEKGKLIVLIDETSASASEVLAGALQDWDRATIIGRRSFGKGLVQQQFNLSDGGALRLTVARYYTPLGRNIQKPYNQGKKKYMQELEERFHSNGKLKEDSGQQKGAAFKTPSGHIVYGGGGITPDYNIEFDTTMLNSVYGKLYYKDVFERFAYKYYTTNKAGISSYKTAADIKNKFELTNADWKLLQAIAAKDSIDVSNLNSVVKQEIIDKTRAVAARQIISNSAYFEINNINDTIVKKALEIIKK